MRLTIYNSSGKLKKDVFIIGNNQQIDVSKLSAGMYFYQVSDGTWFSTGKMVVN